MSNGYLGNNYLKRSNEVHEFTPEQIKEYLKCAEDPIYFASKYIKIVHVDKGFVPFDMYDYQKEITRKITDNRRVAVLTARQSGKTTTACAVILHYILFNEFKTVAILANKGTRVILLLKMVVKYMQVPQPLQLFVVNQSHSYIWTRLRLLKDLMSSSLQFIQQFHLVKLQNY